MMLNETYDVPTKTTLLRIAAMIDAHDPDLLEADLHDYSDEINGVLLEIRAGRRLSRSLCAELSRLYDRWEDDGFPIDEVDDDAIQEGGPAELKRLMRVTTAVDDPDAFPDPADL